jgi:hypothetical protein
MFEQLLGNFMGSQHAQDATQALMQRGYSQQDAQSMIAQSLPAAAQAMYGATQGHPSPGPGLLGMLQQGLGALMGGGGGMMGGMQGPPMGQPMGPPGMMGPPQGPPMGSPGMMGPPPGGMPPAMASPMMTPMGPQPGGGAIGMINNNIAQSLSQQNGMHPTQASDVASVLSGFIARFTHDTLIAAPEVDVRRFW